MNNILVIDGSSMLVTAYYGTLPKSITFAKTKEEKESHYSEILQTKTGVYTNAILPMLKTILKIINENDFQYIAVVFDKTRNTFRKELYPEYKGTRDETPSPLKEQFITMTNILNRLGIATFSSDVYEADDLAGSIIEKFRHRKIITKDGIEEYEHRIRFMTKDRDYLQLIGNNVRGWMVQTTIEKQCELFNKYNVSGISIKELHLPDKVVEFTDETVLGELGVLPSQIADLKGIAGDSSDNIPGVYGVNSAAAPLLREYGTISNLYNVIEACNDDPKAEKELQTFWKDKLGIKRSPMKALKEHKADAILSKTLATIKTDIDVPEDLSVYEIHLNKNDLENIINEYELNSLKHFLDPQN